MGLQAGGIMAFVPFGTGNTNVDICLSQLRDEGYTESTVIGIVTKGPRDPNRPSHQTITCK